MTDNSRAASRYRTSLQAAHAVANDRHPLTRSPKVGFREFNQGIDERLRPARIPIQTGGYGAIPDPTEPIAQRTQVAVSPRGAPAVRAPAARRPDVRRHPRRRGRSGATRVRRRVSTLRPRGRRGRNRALRDSRPRFDDIAFSGVPSRSPGRSKTRAGSRARLSLAELAAEHPEPPAYRPRRRSRAARASPCVGFSGAA